MKDIFFKPSFGNTPRIMVGRSDVTDDFEAALESDLGSRERSLLLLGQRGMGKTVLLLEFEQMAKEKGYIVTHPIVSAPGLLDKISQQIYKQASRYIDIDKREITGGNVGGFGFSAGLQFKIEKKHKAIFSMEMEEICRKITDTGKGVVFIIDEVQSMEDELREFVITFQSLVGMGLNVSAAFAGLPRTVSSLLQTNVLTFLNRSPKIYLNPLKEGDMSCYFYETFKEAGCDISIDLCDTAATATMGSPYMMQLIGHYVIKQVEEGCTINNAHIQNAIRFAKNNFNNDISEAVLKDLSYTDMEFLKAMALHDGDKILGQNIIRQMNVSQAYYQQYKKRLMDAGVIEKVRRGTIAFSIPYIKEYLLENYMDTN